ncbi:hypothetical protein K458DRAFT_385996 [Lentithecium fluviatile CBS 122367]|uniref:Uncharacterized protein n=1 Tax=Lentithecium fluviatile CBS 122367 TaxID=1168545 RepID=A0A6G1JAI5_9PLEO|nr:hypothetical protein K458DRAFT_385996 [Lentithecium fluviatile CBS 122367]
MPRTPKLQDGIEATIASIHEKEEEPEDLNKPDGSQEPWTDSEAKEGDGGDCEEEEEKGVEAENTSSTEAVKGDSGDLCNEWIASESEDEPESGDDEDGEYEYEYE